jgi:hypothetical protein
MVTLQAMKSSIREIPVTISAFNMGILVTVIKKVLALDCMPLMATEAAVPIMVAIKADKRAMDSVVYSAFIMEVSENRDTYQFRVNPPHFALVLEALKERPTRVRMGAYNKIKIRVR